MSASIPLEPAPVPVRGLATAIRRPCVRRVYAETATGVFRVSKRETYRVLAALRRRGRPTVTVGAPFGPDELMFA